MKLFFSICLLLSFFACSKKASDKPRLGYLLNITHAVPIVAIEEGLFDDYELTHYLSGGYLLNSLMSKNIDIAYIGPGPYINAINKGLELELLDLSAVGANSFLLSDHFNENPNFQIKTIAVPQFGNTQDLLARRLVTKLKERHAAQEKINQALMDMASQLLDIKKINIADDLEFMAISPAELEMVLHGNDIDAAIVAEPWGTLLAQRGYKNLSAELAKKNLVNSLDDGFETVLKDEIKSMNDFPATLLVVRKEYYENHPRVIENLKVKQEYVKDILALDTESALKSIQSHYKRIAGKSFSYKLLKESFNKIKFESELDFAKLAELEQIAFDAKYIKEDK